MEYKYPIYKKAKYQDITNPALFVIKFTGLGTGEVVECIDNPGWEIGEMSKSFIEHTDTDHWEDYNPEVQLKTYKVIT